jgi:hypothetical protein
MGTKRKMRYSYAPHDSGGGSCRRRVGDGAGTGGGGLRVRDGWWRWRLQEEWLKGGEEEFIIGLVLGFVRSTLRFVSRVSGCYLTVWRAS